MKKLNKKGFTLIELLAVIVILGILMLTAIPAVTRAITKSRRNTFWQNAKQYIQAAQTPFLSGEYVKTDGEGHATSEICGTPEIGTGYYLELDALELEGGSTSKSSFGASYETDSCKPKVIVFNAGKEGQNGEPIDRLVWYFVGTDESHNGIDSPVAEGNLGLGSVKVSNAGKQSDGSFSCSYTISYNNKDVTPTKCQKQ